MANIQEPMDVDMDGRAGSSKEELEAIREDGELPALTSAASVMKDDTLTPQKGHDSNHSKQLALISKSIVSPVSVGKSKSHRKYDDDLDLILYTDSDLDEPAETETEAENAAAALRYDSDKSWADYGAREFRLVLTRKANANERNVKLEAKVHISKEYPLRPPLFKVNLLSSGGSSENQVPDWHNEVHAIEAEVNLHMLKMVPPDQEAYTITHQVYCLAMLFDYLIDEASPSSEKSKGSSVIDVGLCKPVSGRLLARSFRGRDRRKMISWKDMECTEGYPF